MIARAIAPILVAVVALSASPARAFDPSTADADARGIVESEGYAFCKEPDDPLSPRARALCPLAGEIPGCSALVEACDKPPPEQPKLSPFWERFWNGVAAFLARALPVMAWILVVAVGGLVAYLIVRAIRAAKQDELPIIEEGKGSDVKPLPESAAAHQGSAAEVLLARAAEALARGDSRDALFLYLAASLRALDDRGAIRVAKDRTNGEYVRACQEAPSRPLLRDLVRDVDSVQFGGADATLDAAARASDRAVRIVRAPGLLAPLATLVLLALALTACRVGSSGKSDPSGRELLVDLLEKQGAKVVSLGGSLAHLPMKGDDGPAVIVDVERVTLEDETKKHLVEWVKQGGTLVLAGSPALWPSEFWAKPTEVGGDAESRPSSERAVKVKVVTRDAPARRDDDDDAPSAAALPRRVRHATIAHARALTWPSDDPSPRAIARLEDRELYGALRAFGEGKILGLASGDLFTNAGLLVPGNAAALVALLGTLDKTELSIARNEQGIAPPENPFAGLVHIGLGPALLHVIFFLPLLFLAYGVRQISARAAAPPPRRAFAEHVRAVGRLYARRRVAPHALAAYAKHVDDRLRGMSRGADPADFLAASARADVAATRALYARSVSSGGDHPPRGDELDDLARLGALYGKALELR